MNEYEETEEITLGDIEKHCKDIFFKKVMEIIINEEKEKYFLKITQEGEKLLQHFNVKAIVTQEEETKTSKLQKQL